jgi:hypothetical protein
MSMRDVLSDQYYQWSDRYAKDVRLVPEKEASHSIKEAARSGKAHTGIADRALQALRKAGMQMRNRRWSWAKVLPLDTPAWWCTIDGVRTAVIRRTGQRVLGELSPGSGNLGRGLPNQSGAFTPSRKSLIDEDRTRRDAGSVVRDVRCEHSGRAPPSGRLFPFSV